MSQFQFDTFFRTATGNTPYSYQSRLAGHDSGTACHSQLINIPTGLGKTAAVVLAWLWNRVKLERTDWPRRLVYCLPMRTLVEQTQEEIRKWLDAQGLLWTGLQSTHARKIGVHILMGGEDASEWDMYPEENAILIGTQDMLLSRALNRGYAAGRARWPRDFAILNNDCLWVFDEVQLMSTGFATSLQLQAWRESQTIQPAIPTFSWWMSATVEQEWLASAVDFVPSIELRLGFRMEGLGVRLQQFLEAL
jgi:CRISPR-associated endonuclease/helicase Cas3